MYKILILACLFGFASLGKSEVLPERPLRTTTNFDVSAGSTVEMRADKDGFIVFLNYEGFRYTIDTRRVGLGGEKFVVEWIRKGQLLEIANPSQQTLNFYLYFDDFRLIYIFALSCVCGLVGFMVNLTYFSESRSSREFYQAFFSLSYVLWSVTHVFTFYACFVWYHLTVLGFLLAIRFDEKSRFKNHHVFIADVIWSIGCYLAHYFVDYELFTKIAFSTQLLALWLVFLVVRYVKKNPGFNLHNITLVGSLVWVSAISVIGGEYYIVTGLVQSGYILLLTVNLVKNSIRNAISLQIEIRQKQHTLTQLKKIVYPHQIRMISDGHQLEETMPAGQHEAVVIAFDVIGSSRIEAAKSRSFLQSALKHCLAEIHEGVSADGQPAYDAYRVKEMGDGFLVSIGHPFAIPTLPNNKKNIVETSMNLANRFIRVFDQERKKHKLSVHCAMGMAFGPVESFFPEEGVKEFDVYGRGIILAARYESLRKKFPAEWIKQSDLVIAHNSLIEELSSESKDQFKPIDLRKEGIVVQDDEGADFAWLRCS